MDIEVIKKAKAQCESEIRAIVKMFEHQSGLVVSQINVDDELDTRSNPWGAIIKMDVRL